MKTSTSFNIKLIENACKERYLKPLALFYLIKAKFDHSIIYNYTPNKLARLSGLHHQTVKNYIRVLQQKGLVIERDGNLLFVKASKVIKGTFKSLPTRPYTSFEGILDRLQYIILINNKAKQTYKIAVNGDEKILGSLSPRVRKKAIRQASKTKIEQPGLESLPITKPILTVRNASKMFNVSQRTSANIINNLKNKNYIKLKALVVRIDKIPKKYFKGFDGSYFYSKGYLFRYIGREISEGSYPRLNSMY